MIGASSRPSGRTPVRSDLDDVVLAPVAEAGFPVGGEVRTVEHPEPRNLETDLGTAEKARRVRLAEEVARRMAVGAEALRHQVFAARERSRGRPPPRASRRSVSAAATRKPVTATGDGPQPLRHARDVPGMHLPPARSCCCSIPVSGQLARHLLGLERARQPQVCAGKSAKLRLNRMFDWNDLRYFLAVARRRLDHRGGRRSQGQSVDRAAAPRGAGGGGRPQAGRAPRRPATG